LKISDATQNSSHIRHIFIIKRKMEMEELSGFNLAGGTSMAMQIGHRVSYDLDFFGKTPMNVDEIFNILNKRFQFKEIHRTKSILIGDINSVKVDFVNYQYPLLDKIHQFNSVSETEVRRKLVVKSL
jgi:hypothetical protein